MIRAVVTVRSGDLPHNSNAERACPTTLRAEEIRRHSKDEGLDQGATERSSKSHVHLCMTSASRAAGRGDVASLADQEID